MNEIIAVGVLYSLRFYVMQMVKSRRKYGNVYRIEEEGEEEASPMSEYFGYASREIA